MSEAISVLGLTKKFGGVTAVDGLTFSVSPGETVALLGPNGSGKTTTIRTLAGLLRPTGGRALVMGEDIKANPKRAAAKMAYLPQQALFPPQLTAREIILFHAALRKIPAEKALSALRNAGIEEKNEARPAGTFSGGMKQRLSLAIVLASCAPVLLLDEPTANLDPLAAINFRQTAKKWRAEGKALLIATHVLSDVEELADRVVIVVEGRAVAVITTQELRLKLQSFARLRVDAAAPSEDLIRRAITCGATFAKKNGHAVIVTAPVEKRLAILDGIASIGEIRHFETEEPSLEDLYIEYVKGAGDGIS